jgi:hypothetical protein
LGTSIDTDLTALSPGNDEDEGKLRLETT